MLGEGNTIKNNSRLKVIFKKNLLAGIYLLLLVFFFFLYIRFHIEASIYVFLSLIGVGWSVFFFREKMNILEHMMLGPIIFAVITVVLSSLISIVGISISSVWLYSFVIGSVVFFIYKNIFSSDYIKLDLDKSDIFILIIFVLAFTAKVISIFELSTPNLSDELVHAYYSKIIVETGKISFFYSPGLHILSAISNMSGGYDVARQVLLITNFFSAYSGVVAYLYVKKVFKNNIASISAGILFSLGIGLTFLFYSAGKNSLIIGTSSLLFFFLSLDLLKRNNAMKNIVLSAIALFAVFLMHYPTALFACVYLAIKYLLALSAKKLRGLAKKYFYVSIGAAFGFSYLFITNSLYGTGSEGASLSISNKILSVPENFLERVFIGLEHIYQDIMRYALQDYPKVIIYLFILSVTILLINIFISKNRKEYLNFLLFTILSAFVFLVISTFSMQQIEIVAITHGLLLFLYVYTIISLGIGSIYELIGKFISKEIVFYTFSLLLLIIATVMTNNIYKKYSDKLRTTVVTSQDLEMFKWIDLNLSDKEKILVDSFEYRKLIMPADSGGWIPIFSDNNISTPFWEFSSGESIRDYEHYLELVNNPGNCKSLRYFKGEGFDYYYKGSVDLYPNNIPISIETPYENWELIHNIGNTFLYKIPSCSE